MFERFFRWWVFCLCSGVLIWSETVVGKPRLKPYDPWNPPNLIHPSPYGNESMTDVYQCPKPDSNHTDHDTLTVFPEWIGQIKSTGNTFHAWMATVHLCSLFSFQIPDFPKKCDVRQTTLETATQYDCIYAMNGGFFDTSSDPPPLCEPNLIVNHLPIVISDGLQRTNFALTDQQILVGYPSDIDSDSNVSKYRSLISGAGWLVRDGESYVVQSPGINVNSSFVTEKAPRTGLGVFSNGSILLLEADGIEDESVGLDLFEFAELFTYAGVESAVNIDGGGSSTVVYKGEVRNQPTCNDTPIVCQRQVVSIVCIR